MQPLNIRTIKSAVTGARQYVQDEKIQVSRRTITRFQYGDRWPDDYLSYVTSETKRNQYKDPIKFFRVMHAKPEWYARKFIFRPLIDSADEIRQATIDAHRIVIDQASKYGTVSGHYASSFRVLLDDQLLSGISKLDNLNNDSVTKILNTAAYAGTVEKNALYFSQIGGVIYYAAKVIQKRYPRLGVRFGYFKSVNVAGTTSKYDVPVLTIGTRDRVIDKLVRPGKRHRRRNRRSNR
jgi:hypothetical protein